MSGFPQPIRADIGENDANVGAFALREVICEEVRAVCTHFFGARIRAIILTGSLARDEGTFSRPGDMWTSPGDAEFLIIASRRTFLPSAEEIGDVRRQINNRLLLRKISCKVDLGAAYVNYLRNLPPHIFSYELRECGKVIWGDSSVLNLIPRFPVQQLALEDAWQLLCNRLIELLAFPVELASNGSRSSAKFRYHIQKLYLDMATSFLVFVRAYAPGYQRRQEILSRLAEEKPCRDEYPFDLREFAVLLAVCTKRKLSCVDGDEGAVPLDPGEAIRTAHRLWRWELEQLTGAEEALADCDLIGRWMHGAPFQQRVRGWLVVLSACGWHKSIGSWARWLKLGREASPRGCIYFVASGILFKFLGERTRSHETDWRKDATALMDFLPMRKPDAEARASVRWEDLASDATWNYQRFLVGSRS